MQDVAPEEAKILSNGQCLRCHCERRLRITVRNGMLMPVINGIVESGGVCSLPARPIRPKLTLAEGSWLRVVAFAGAFGSAALLSAGKPELAATIPDRDAARSSVYQTVASASVFHSRYCHPDHIQTSFSAQILSLKPAVHSTNEDKLCGKVLKKTAFAPFFIALIKFKKKRLVHLAGESARFASRIFIRQYKCRYASTAEGALKANGSSRRPGR